MELLREHAVRLGIRLPEGNILDRELPFINYRLLSWRLGQNYPGKLDDSSLSLLWCAFEVLRNESFPWKLRVAHALWFLSVCGLPPSLVRTLIRVRFDRARWVEELTNRLSRAIPGRVID